MFEILDVVIGLAIIYMILSMVNKYLMSIIKRVFQLKGSVIREEMQTFIGEKTWKYFVAYLENHAKYLNILDLKRRERALERDKKEKQKTKRTETYARRISQLDKDQLRNVIEDLREFMLKTPTDKVVDTLGLTCVEEHIDKEIEIIKRHLGNLASKIDLMYDNTMKKISDAYERRIRSWTLMFGLVVALFVNADFFQIYTSLTTNPALRAQLISETKTITDNIKEFDERLENKKQKEPDSLEKLSASVKQDVTNLHKTLRLTSITFGWSQEELDRLFRPTGKEGEDHLNRGFVIFNKVIGIIISSLLISFGTPFWHDLLNLVSGLRGRIRASTRGVASVRT